MSSNLRNAFDILLMAIGLVAVPIPIVPGLPLIAAGAAIASEMASKARIAEGKKQPRLILSRDWIFRFAA